MSDLVALAQELTEEEARVMAGALRRLQARPVVVVTVAEGSRHRRYVVDREDEGLFEGLSGGVGVDDEDGGRAWRAFSPQVVLPAAFGCQWIRRMGCVDECHRLLGMTEVVEVARMDAHKVWGTECRGRSAAVVKRVRRGAVRAPAQGTDGGPGQLALGI